MWSSVDVVESLPPTRIADTRTGVNTGGATSIARGAHITIQVTGTGASPDNDGIPDDAKAVAINLTAINPNSYGNLRVYPDGAPVPNASNINYIPDVNKAGSLGSAPRRESGRKNADAVMCKLRGRQQP